MTKNPTPSARETFYEQVFRHVMGVPSGRVVTYGQVALELGAPAAARAVGYALYFLPPGTEVPWWRVINVRGEISLKNRGEAADVQRRLLEDEGVVFDAAGRTDLQRYRWWLPDETDQPPASFDPGT